MSKFFIFLIFSIFLSATLQSCDKRSHKRIKYQVISKTSCEIGYEINNKWYTESDVSGEWSKSYRVKVGSDFHLAAFKTGPFFDVTISVYFDGELYSTVVSSESLELIEIEGIVP